MRFQVIRDKETTIEQFQKEKIAEDWEEGHQTDRLSVTQDAGSQCGVEGGTEASVTEELEHLASGTVEGGIRGTLRNREKNSKGV